MAPVCLVFPRNSREWTRNGARLPVSHSETCPLGHDNTVNHWTDGCKSHRSSAVRKHETYAIRNGNESNRAAARQPVAIRDEA
jgi:hypothetical protein